MSGVGGKQADVGGVDEDVPPVGTAIVRSLRHVRAVRERQAEQMAARGVAGSSRSARAWSWVLGESDVAPVTDRVTEVPASRSEVGAEIAVADERRLRGDREDRADGSASVLRWLIGEDDRVPVRGEGRGELVDGFGDVVRSPAHIAGVLATADEARRRAARTGDVGAEPSGRGYGQQDADYLDGVVATLAWVLAERAEAPLTGVHHRELTTRDLKIERVHAEDVIDQARQPGMLGRLPAPQYGEGVKSSITWLLGGSIAPPVDQAGHDAQASRRRS